MHWMFFFVARREILADFLPQKNERYELRLFRANRPGSIVTNTSESIPLRAAFGSSGMFPLHQDRVVCVNESRMVQSPRRNGKRRTRLHFHRISGRILQARRVSSRA